MKIPFLGGASETPAPLDPALVAPMSTPARPELTGGRKIGVLVVHGFTGSPASMRPWAEDLVSRGYAVEMPLLPGHGTRWQDMNKVTWADWVATVEGAFDKLAAENDAVVAVGLSMGGALSLRLAADRGEELAGLVLVNAAVDTMRKDKVLLPLLKHIVPAFPGIRNDIKKPGMDEIAYPVIPLKAAAQMSDGWVDLRRTCPRSPSRSSTSAPPRTTSPTSRPPGPSMRACPRRTSRSGSSRTATTSPPSTTTPRRSSRSRPSSSAESPRIAARLDPVLYWFLKWIAIGPVLRLVFRPKAYGIDNVPEEGPAILASNHLSYADWLFMPLTLNRRVTFVAKAEYFTTPGVKGWFQKKFFSGAGQVPIDRSGASAAEGAMKSAMKILAEGDLFGIYPEGTRSHDGRLYRGKTGVARLALESKAPVIPCAVVGTDVVAPAGKVYGTWTRPS